MKRLILATLSIIAITHFSCSTKEKSIKGEFEQTIDYSKFANPPAEYRSHLFYSLNDELTIEEVERQVESFKEAGVGGYYLHSRVGLLTEYLSDDWWQIIDAAIDKGNSVGLQAYFYDEDRWPSGYAGGKIPLMDESFRAQSLARLALDTKIPEEAIVLTSDDKYNYVSYPASLDNPLFNGTSYVDLMNPHGVKAFLESTHKEYFDRFLNKLPYTAAFFSDEPHIHSRYFDRNTKHQGVVTYSPFLRERFETEFGYDFVDKIELLFEEKDNWREVRLQYQQAVAKQFSEAFTKQMADYCEKYGVRYTGHYLGEESLAKVAERIGNAMMHYQYMPIPGMDMLGMQLENRLNTPKSVSSVANQIGAPRRLSELFGISGHNMSFEDKKRVANWHAINGINHYVPHLALYSLKGIRKRDYPPTFSYHQPYWELNKPIEDYMARISYVTTIGKYNPQIALLHPLESEFIIAKKEGNFTKEFLLAMEALHKNNYDFDLVDEEILSKIGKIKKKKLVVGEMNYPIVLIPDMISIRETTLNILIDFANKGGKIISAGSRFPQFVDGVENDDKIQQLKNVVEINNVDNFVSTLKSIQKPNISIDNDIDGEVWSQVRKCNDGNIIILTNTSNKELKEIEVESDLLTKNVVLWNPNSGKCYSLKPTENGKYQIEIPQSDMVILTTNKLSDNAVIEGEYEKSIETIFAESLNEFEVTRHNPNALTVDFAQYSTDNGKTWSNNEPITGIFDRLSHQNYNGNLSLKYNFKITDIPTNISVVVESPEQFTKTAINNREIAFDKNSYFLDKDFLSSEIGFAVKKGNNELLLELDFRSPQPLSADSKIKYGTEIESIYIIGDFGVKGNNYEKSYDSQRNRAGMYPVMPVHRFTDFEIVKENNITNGDLSISGYPFFAGSATLKTEFKMPYKIDTEEYFLEFPLSEAMVIEVKVNNVNLESQYWSPYICDISDALHEGNNVIEIKITNSLRNILGPHHHTDKEVIRVGPSSFSGIGGFPNARGLQNWYDIRQKDGKAAYWTDDYYFIPFGFIKQPIISVKK